MDPTRVALPLSVFEGQNPNVDPAQVPLPPSFAETSAKNPADNSHPSVASLYLKYAQETDETALSLWHSDLDVLLIFVRTRIMYCQMIGLTGTVRLLFFLQWSLHSLCNLSVTCKKISTKHPRNFSRSSFSNPQVKNQMSHYLLLSKLSGRQS